MSQDFDANNYCGCPLCYGVDGEHCQKTERIDSVLFECQVCGIFSVTKTVETTSFVGDKLQLPDAARVHLSQMAILSSERFNRDEGDYLEIKSSLVDALKANPPYPDSVTRQINSLVRQAGDNWRKTGKTFGFWAQPRLRAGCLSETALYHVLDMAELEGIFKKQGRYDRFNTRGGTRGMPAYLLTLKGWKLYSELTSTSYIGDFGFLAMKFGDSRLEEFVKNCIKPGIEKELHVPLRDVREHSKAGVIDNVLTETIREAQFVIVDLTHDNNGAYWEAGFAEGLGKPVVYICEKQKFNNLKTHFDTNHRTTVLWEEERAEDFVSELVATLKRSMVMS